MRSHNLSHSLLGPNMCTAELPHTSWSLFSAVSLRKHWYLNTHTRTQRHRECKVGHSAGIPSQCLLRIFTKTGAKTGQKKQINTRMWHEFSLVGDSNCGQTAEPDWRAKLMKWPNGQLWRLSQCLRAITHSRSLHARHKLLLINNHSLTVHWAREKSAYRFASACVVRRGEDVRAGAVDARGLMVSESTPQIRKGDRCCGAVCSWALILGLKVTVFNHDTIHSNV